LALELERLDVAHGQMSALKDADRDTTDTINKWKRLGDLALTKVSSLI